MQWEILSLDDLKAFSQANLLPRQNHSFPVFADETGLLTLPPPKEKIPVIFFSSREELQVWELLVRWHPQSKTDLARYGKYRHFEPSAFMEALGYRVNYRSLDEWKESSDFSDITASLDHMYDLPVSMLRLCNRLSVEELMYWIDVFTIHKCKKNYIIEIIKNYYDIAPPQRQLLRERFIELEKDILHKSEPFPWQTFMEYAREVRFPELYAEKKKLDVIRQKIETKFLHVTIPEDLESGFIELKLRIARENDFDLGKKYIDEKSDDILQLIKLWRDYGRS